MYRRCHRDPGATAATQRNEMICIAEFASLCFVIVTASIDGINQSFSRPWLAIVSYRVVSYRVERIESIHMYSIVVVGVGGSDYL